LVCWLACLLFVHGTIVASRGTLRLSGMVRKGQQLPCIEIPKSTFPTVHDAYTNKSNDEALEMCIGKVLPDNAKI